MTGDFDPLYPLEDALELFEALRVPKEIWVIENRFHPLWKLPNLGSLDAHEYVLDWLGTVLGGPGLPRDHARIAYVRQRGDSPFGDCEWTPPVGPGQAYFRRSHEGQRLRDGRTASEALDAERGDVDGARLAVRDQLGH